MGGYVGRGRPGPPGAGVAGPARGMRRAAARTGVITSICVIALVALAAAAPPAPADPAAAPIVIWPIPQEARYTDDRLLLRRRRHRRAQGRRPRAVSRPSARGAARRPVRGRDPGRRRARPPGRTPIVVGGDLPPAPRLGGGRDARSASVPDTAEGTSFTWEMPGPSSPGATIGARSTASPRSSSSSTAGATRAWPFARRASGTGRFSPSAGSTSTCPAAISSVRRALPARLPPALQVERDRARGRGGDAPRFPSRDQRRVAAHGRRVVRARRDDGQARRGDPAGNREPLRGLAPRGGGRRGYVEKDDVRRPGRARRATTASRSSPRSSRSATPTTSPARTARWPKTRT